MRVAVIGGKLQGVEATYLAQKAGWEVTLVDKKSEVPASGLCNDFYQLDVTHEKDLKGIVEAMDLVIPAMENQAALDSLANVCREKGIPLIFDSAAYSVSSSKARSKKLFSKIGIPAPASWPDCGYPVIAKPSTSSGSEGVIQIRNQYEYKLHKARSGNADEWVIEQYLEGPSYSVEVIGFEGVYKVLQITELQMDKFYDCKRVIAPAKITEPLTKQFEVIALTLAKSLKLQGIMDVEVILHKGELKVLEIDARLPSQTPTAVFHSTGVNMLKLLGEAFATGKTLGEIQCKETKAVLYEHIQVHPYRIEVWGEHIMGQTKKLHLYEDFFGAAEALTDYIPGKNQWAATLIITGRDFVEAWANRGKVIKRIMKEFGIKSYVDMSPIPAAENYYNIGTI